MWSFENLLLCFLLQVLSLHETLTASRSVYYIGTIIPVVLLILGSVVKPPSRSKLQKKAQWCRTVWYIYLTQSLSSWFIQKHSENLSLLMMAKNYPHFGSTWKIDCDFCSLSFCSCCWFLYFSSFCLETMYCNLTVLFLALLETEMVLKQECQSSLITFYKSQIWVICLCLSNLIISDTASLKTPVD